LDARSVVILFVPSAFELTFRCYIHLFSLASNLLIGDDAFGGCSSLKAITIPNSVTSIGNGAFNDCDSLKSITIKITDRDRVVMTIGREVFNGINPNATIKVPAKMLKGYKEVLSGNVPSTVKITKL
jgi:hypothetical protein